MAVPYFDYRPGYHALRDEIREAIDRVLESGALILGPEVAAFEREFARWLGTGEAVGVASGSDALVLALRALGVGPGDEVITVASAGVPPVAAVREVGATPRFVDVTDGALLMDPEALEGVRSTRTRCVLPVHLYGQPAPLEPILAFAARHGLAVIEDCAQAHGATYDGRRVGTLGAVGCFSFYPTKNLGAFGDGGLCVSSDATLAATIRAERMYGFDERRHAWREGVNSRLDELQAAILRVKLRHLDAAIAERQRIAARYIAALGDGPYGLPPTLERGTHVYHLFVIRVPERERVVAALRAAGIGCGFHYPEPPHLMQAYRFLGYLPGDLPVTEQASTEVLSLPLYPGLADSAVDEVVRVLRGAA